MSEQGEKQLWTGPCIGGPMGAPGTSTPGQSRYPKGFVYYDRPNGLVWIYDWSELDQKFFVRNESPERADKDRIRAIRDRYDWDIRTAEEEVSRVYNKHPYAQPPS